MDGHRPQAVVEVEGGTTWELQVQDVGAAGFGFCVVGTSPANAPLSVFGSLCTRAVALDLAALRVADGVGNLQPWTPSIPNDLTLVGFRLFAQGVVEHPIGGSFQGFLGLPFATTWTDALRGTVGSS